MQEKLEKVKVTKIQSVVFLFFSFTERSPVYESKTKNETILGNLVTYDNLKINQPKKHLAERHPGLRHSIKRHPYLRNCVTFFPIKIPNVFHVLLYV